jgi:hypothetical protein
MTRAEVARRKRMIEAGRRWERNWIKRGRPSAGRAMQFQESVTPTGTLRRSATATFHEVYSRLTRRG